MHTIPKRGTIAVQGAVGGAVSHPLLRLLLHAAARAVRRSVLAALVGAALAAGVAGGVRTASAHDAGAPVVQVRVLRSIPHDAGAFTQGLFFAGGRLYETTGRRGRSTIRELDPESGAVLRRENLPERFFGEGSTAVGDAAYWLTWTAERGFVYGLEDFRPRGGFGYSGEGWGLACDGERLVMSDGSDTLTFRDPATFEALSLVQVRDGDRPIRHLNELEWVRGAVYANVWGSPMIAVIDPATGGVRRWLDLRPLMPRGVGADAVANGLAWHGEEGALYATGKLWPVMYVLDVD